MTMSNAYGEWLRARREAAGLTQQQLADAAFMTRSHVAHIEAGRRFPSEEDARRLDLALGTGDVLTCFRPRKDEDDTIAGYFEPARHLEQQATMIHEYASVFVPGILQTEAYARAVIGQNFPPRTAEECDRHVVSRLRRSEILNDPATPVVCALLEDTVLRRPVGGPKAMAEQVNHLIRLAESERVRVHLLPLSLGVHTMLHGMLSLMWFDDQPPAAYSEGFSFGRVHDSPSMVHDLQSSYALALGEALPTNESLALMRTIAKEHEEHG
jgi:transcriptional regulator with XRE-family HTH domain